MKLLLVTHYMPPHHGGIERIAEDHAAAAAAAGHDVTWVASRVPASAAAAERAPWGQAIRVPAWNGFEAALGVPYPVWPPAAARAVRELVRACDLVHAHDVLYPGTSVALAEARRRGKPALLTQHVGFVPMRNALAGAVERLAYATIGRRNAGRATAVAWYSETALAWLRARCGLRGRAVYLPNPVDADLFRPAHDAAEKRALRAKHGLPAEVPVVLFVGRLVFKKGAHLLVEAADPGAHLLLVGERGAVDLGGRAHVELRGFVERTTLAELMRAADVFALPSVGEGFPLVAQEAMASGLAVLLADDPALVREVDAGAALFVPPQVPELRAALARLVRDPEERRRLGEHARASALGRWGRASCRQRLLETYEELSAPAS